MSDMWGYVLDRSLYDHPGAEVSMGRAIRRYRERPALAKGEQVTIVRFKSLAGQYGPEPRLLVRTATGAERWISAVEVTGLPEAHGIKTAAR
jgi:hypothetical protein